MVNQAKQEIQQKPGAKNEMQVLLARRNLIKAKRLSTATAAKVRYATDGKR